jgi:hypothetical protein
LQAAVDGLFVALSGWRIVALHLELLRADQGRREADLIQRNLPPAFRSVPVEGGEEVSWTFEALHLPPGVHRRSANFDDTPGSRSIAPIAR